MPICTSRPLLLPVDHVAICDNANVIQFRRVAALLLGLWLGAGIFADFAVNQNFRNVEGFLADPGAVSTSIEMNHIGRWKERIIIRRYVAELNNTIFETWEWVEIVLGTALFATLVFGERPKKWMLAVPLVMLLIVAAQRFYLTPNVADLARKLADLSPKDPLNGKFWTFHGIYSGAEIVKLALGAALALRLSVKGKADPDYFVKQFAGRSGSKSAGEAGSRG